MSSSFDSRNSSPTSTSAHIPMIANTIAGTLKIGSEVLVTRAPYGRQAAIGCPTVRRKPGRLPLPAYGERSEFARSSRKFRVRGPLHESEHRGKVPASSASPHVWRGSLTPTLSPQAGRGRRGAAPIACRKRGEAAEAPGSILCQRPLLQELVDVAQDVIGHNDVAFGGRVEGAAVERRIGGLQVIEGRDVFAVSIAREER